MKILAQYGFMLFVFISALSGCGSEVSLEQPAESIAADKLFPLSDGNSWTYKRRLVLGSGTPDITSEKFVAGVAAMPDGQSGFDIVDPDKGVMNWISMLNAARDGNIVSWSGFIGAAKTGFNPPFIMLPQTLTAGAEWTWNGEIIGKQSAPATIKNKFEGIEEVTIPAGTFKCVRIYRVLNDKINIWHWYAPGVGLVKIRASKVSAGIIPATEDLYELESYSVN